MTLNDFGNKNNKTSMKAYMCLASVHRFNINQSFRFSFTAFLARSHCCCYCFFLVVNSVNKKPLFVKGHFSALLAPFKTFFGQIYHHFCACILQAMKNLKRNLSKFRCCHYLLLNQRSHHHVIAHFSLYLFIYFFFFFQTCVCNWRVERFGEQNATFKGINKYLHTLKHISELS